MKKAKDSLQDSNNPNIELFTISLSLIILITSITFLEEGILII
jgi:hypothetical protein